MWVIQDRLDKGLPAYINSKSLGGPCKVLSVSAVSGYWLGQAKTTLFRGDTLNGEFQVPKAAGLVFGGGDGPDSQLYKHLWLNFEVETPHGKRVALSLDPTQEQFGQSKAIVTWHKDMHDKLEEQRHILPKVFESLLEYKTLEKVFVSLECTSARVRVYQTNRKADFAQRAAAELHMLRSHFPAYSSDLNEQLMNIHDLR